MLKSVLPFITNSSILLALFSFAFTFGLHSSWEEKTSYSSAIFFSVLGIYNFHRLYKFQKKQLNFPISNWVAKNQRIIQSLSLVGTVPPPPPPLFLKVGIYTGIFNLYEKNILIVAAIGAGAYINDFCNQNETGKVYLSSAGTFSNPPAAPLPTNHSFANERI
jgi:hypothetical protein